MPKRIAIFGGSFNPPHLAHQGAVRTLAASEKFDEIIVVPCGPRPDKLTVYDIEPIHRAAMADMTFRGIDKVRVDLFDLENGCFTRTRQLDERYRADGSEVWHVVGTDLIAGGGRRESQIHKVWEDPERTWRELRFVVLERPGYECDAADYPLQHMRITSAFVGASSDIRAKVSHRQDITDQVVPRVAAYIERYNLYRGVAPPRKTLLTLREPRVFLDVDAGNPLAVELSQRFTPYAAADILDANCIGVFGGDGTMLRSIKWYGSHRLPFVGVNAGHKGYLLNDPRMIDDAGGPEAFLTDLCVQHLSQLVVTVTAPDGSESRHFAINDAWIERSSLQSIWLKLTVDGRERIKEFHADGALVATPQGSTAYARAMGANTLDTESSECVIAGSNISFPSDLKLAAHHRLDSAIEFESLSVVKRPMVAVVDGMLVGPAVKMAVTASRGMSAELAFAPGMDMSEKRAEDVYPKY